MTDEDLIARLRTWDATPNARAAADRLEALVRERDAHLSTLEHMGAAVERMQKAEARAERLEAALRKLACKCPSNCDWEHDDICPSWIASAALITEKPHDRA